MKPKNEFSIACLVLLRQFINIRFFWLSAVLSETLLVFIRFMTSKVLNKLEKLKVDLLT